jgi:hypothetical protein
MTYSGQDDPQGIQGHLATDPVRDGIQADHPNELAEGLHCAPERRVVCVESHFTFGVPEAEVASEALICNDVSCVETDRVSWECAHGLGIDKLTIEINLVSIRGGCDTQEVADNDSLSISIFQQGMDDQ